MKEIIERSEALRAYLVEHDFAGDDGDIPNDIWLPFCAALKSAEAGQQATNTQSKPLHFSVDPAGNIVEPRM